MDTIEERALPKTHCLNLNGYSQVLFKNEFETVLKEYEKNKPVAAEEIEDVDIGIDDLLNDGI